MSPLSLELRRNWMETKHMVYAVRFITLLLFRRMVQIFLNFSSAVLEELYIGDIRISIVQWGLLITSRYQLF